MLQQQLEQKLIQRNNERKQFEAFRLHFVSEMQVLQENEQELTKKIFDLNAEKISLEQKIKEISDQLICIDNERVDLYMDCHRLKQMEESQVQELLWVKQSNHDLEQKAQEHDQKVELLTNSNEQKDQVINELMKEKESLNESIE